MSIYKILSSLTVCAALFVVVSSKSCAERPLIFGVGTHQSSELEFDYEIKQVGSMADRDDFSLGGCEKEKGIINVKDSYIKFLDRCGGIGLTTVCILDYWNNDGDGRKGFLHWGNGICFNRDSSQYNVIVAGE